MGTEQNKQSTEHMTYPLLDNALDFLLSAAEYAGQDSRRSWKYAILHLIAGIELLLKARLELEHWSLVFQDVDKANPLAFKSGDFRSADFESLLNRLGQISAVHIGKKERDHLNGLKKLRNKLEHFSIDIDLNQVKSLMAKGLSFAVAFYENHLKEEVGDSENRLIGDIIKHLLKFEEFVSERIKTIAPNMTTCVLIRDCPICSQDTLEVQDEAVLHCHFCGYEVDAKTLAEERTEYEVDICPECGHESLEFIVYNNDSAGWECMACGTEFEQLHHCDSCGRLYSGEGPICRECFSVMGDKD